MSFGKILYLIILYPLTQLIELSFFLFDKLFNNTGIAIIGVSFTVTLLCLPLYIVAEHWQQVERDTQAKLKPGIDRIKQTFKGDEQYMILSTYYKQNHYHPMMALRSSFGLLIQIPFFMAAYSCLSKMPALQGHSFLFIRDMGQQDAIFYLGKLPVNILPIAMTIINIIAGAIYCKGFPFKEKAQIYGMALIFLVILYNSPAGLVLYWTMNNVFSLIKNIFYKMKKPLWVLFWCMCVFIGFVDIYILFIYDGGASLTKRLSAVIPLTLLMGIPFYLRAIDWLLKNPLKFLVSDKKLRFKIFIFSSLALCFLTGLVLPSSLISSSVQEFSNVESFTSPTNFLNAPFWHCFGLFVIWPICIYFLFHEKIQTLCASSFLTILVLSIINAFIFTGNYGSMDITLKFIGGIEAQSKLFILLNLLLCIFLIVLTHILLSNKKISYLFSSITFIATFSFVILSVINISKIKKEYNSYQLANSSSNIKDNDFSAKFHFSKNKQNVVVIMLDRAESSYFPHIIQNYPELKETFSGFTYYPNTLSCNAHTLMGCTGLYGGYEYIPSEINKRPEKTLKEKHNEALLLMPKVFTENGDFNATLSDLSWGNYSYVSDMSFVNGMENIEGFKLNGRYTGEFKKELGTTNKTSLIDSANRNLFWVSLFRECPAVLRPVIYYKGSWWSSEETTDWDSFLDWYAPLHYLPQLTSFDNEKSNFILMTNEITHLNEDISSLNLCQNINFFSDDLPGYEINISSLQAIGKWLDYLKENNVYNNTKIIIVADHGMGYSATSLENYETPEIDGFVKDHLNPLLLVKDFNTSGELITDNSFMTNADVPSIAFEGIIENPINPFTSKKIVQNKDNGLLVTTDDLFMPYHSKSDSIFTIKSDSWYKVKENIFVDSNWTQEVQK